MSLEPRLVEVRKNILKQNDLAARALRDKAAVPPCVDAPELFQQVRSGECVLAAADWQAAYAERLHQAIHPEALKIAAE